MSGEVRSEVLELLQFGVESDYGVGVAANRRLYGLMADLDPVIPTERIKSQGSKSSAGRVVGKERTDISLSGQAAYNDLGYLLATLLCSPVISQPNGNNVYVVTVNGGPTGGNFKLEFNEVATGTIAYNASASTVNTALEAVLGSGNVSVSGSNGGPWTVTLRNKYLTSDHDIEVNTNALTGGTTPTVSVTSHAASLAYRWRFLPNDHDADTFESYTVEKGSSVNASKAAGVRCDELELTIVPEKSADLKGKMFGKNLQDGITLTASPVDVALKVLTPRNIDIYFSDSLSTLDANQIDPLEAKFAVKNRHTPVPTIRSSESAHRATAEKDLTCTGQITVEQDTTADTYMDSLREGQTYFLRIIAFGADIETGWKYRVVITMACNFTKNARNPKSDVHCGVYDLESCYDSGFGGSIEVVIETELADL